MRYRGVYQCGACLHAYVNWKSRCPKCGDGAAHSLIARVETLRIAKSVASCLRDHPDAVQYYKERYLIK